MQCDHIQEKHQDQASISFLLRVKLDKVPLAMKVKSYSCAPLHCYTRTCVVEASSIARVGGELFSPTEEDGLIVVHLIAEQNGDQTLGVDYKANLLLHNRKSRMNDNTS